MIWCRSCKTRGPRRCPSRRGRDDRALHPAQRAGRQQRFRSTMLLLGLQNNLRILGIFGALVVCAIASALVDSIPRVWEYVHRKPDVRRL